MSASSDLQEADLELLQRFSLDRVLAADSRSKSMSVVGTIDGQMAIVVAEKTAFDVDRAVDATKVLASRLGFHNDVYNTFFATLEPDLESAPAVKYIVIWPANETHLQKYLPQKKRMVRETAKMYEEVTKPYIATKLGARIAWVYNILDHKKEADRIVYEDPDPVNGFILLPDLKWDCTTVSSLYLIAIVHRRDIHSIRDLRGEHLEYLRKLRDQCFSAVEEKWGVKRCHLRLWLHYQPSYYHLHVHVQTIEYEATEGLAAGKAFLLDDVIENLSLDPDAYAQRTITYVLGESSELFAAFTKTGCLGEGVHSSASSAP